MLQRAYMGGPRATKPRCWGGRSPRQTSLGRSLRPQVAAGTFVSASQPLLLALHGVSHAGWVGQEEVEVAKDAKESHEGSITRGIASCWPRAVMGQARGSLLLGLCCGGPLRRPTILGVGYEGLRVEVMIQ